jgi:hypothetical protein
MFFRKLWAFSLLWIGPSACVSPPREASGRTVTSGTCVRVTIAELAANPARFGGRRICVSGYFGRVIPYGETSTELFATNEEAESGRAEAYLELGVRLNVTVQERLSHHSGEFVNVDGFFEYDPRCWPVSNERESAYRCFPPRPMRVRNTLLRFADGTEFRHPDFGTSPSTR